MTELRYALRGLRLNPGFTISAIAVIALAIGSSAAIFSVVDHILFRALPHPYGARLVTYGVRAPIMPDEFLFGAAYLDFREHQTTFEAVTSWSGVADCDLTDRDPVRLSCARVESTLLSTIGMAPMIGRDFTRGDDRPTAEPVALLTYGLWQGRFGGDPAITGKTVSLDGKTVRVIGVLPSTFETPTLAHADVVLPQQVDEDTFRRATSGRPMSVLARLRPRGTVQEALFAQQPHLDRILAGLPPGFRKDVHLQIRPLRDRQIADVRVASWMFFGAVLAVVLIAGANLANLLFIRGIARERDTSIRLALGASQWRLLRQSLAESSVLAVAGAAFGMAVAAALLKGIVAIAPPGIPRLEHAGIDWRVFGAVAAACFVFALGPLLRVRGAAGLVAAQIAVSLTLLSCAGLLIRTAWNIQNAPSGLRGDNVFAISISLGARHAAPLQFFEQIEQHLSGFDFAMADSIPPATPARSRPYAAIRPGTDGFGGNVVWRAVTPEYFSVLGIPIVRGRAFREEDRRDHVVILSDALARRLFPDRDAIGQTIQLVDWYTVVGIARDVRNSLNLQDDPEYYVPRSHSPQDAIYSNPATLRRATVVVRGANIDAVRAQIATIDPLVPMTIETMPKRLDQLVERPRFNAVLLAIFAAMGLVLAAVGLYGVVSFLVVRRTREIGVRMALGATPASISRMMVSTAARWTIAGALVGLAGAAAASRMLGSMLYGVSPHNAFAMGAPVILLLTVAVAAAWLPARRAARVDPVTALRHD